MGGSYSITTAICYLELADTLIGHNIANVTAAVLLTKWPRSQYKYEIRLAKIKLIILFTPLL